MFPRRARGSDGRAIPGDFWYNRPVERERSAERHHHGHRLPPRRASRPALLESGGRANRLAAHHVLDAARAVGCFDETLAALAADDGWSAAARDLAAKARPAPIRPAVIAHRGLVRALFEPAMAYKPHAPPFGHQARRPVYELDLATFRGHHHYVARKRVFWGRTPVPVEIPTLDDLAAFAARRPDLERVVIDLKLPADRLDLHARFAKALAPILEAGQLGGDRAVLMHTDAVAVALHRRELGGRCAIAHDVEIVSVAPRASSYSAVESALRLGNGAAALGRPVIGIGSYETYHEVLRRDRARIAEAGRPIELFTWTLDDELELRDAMAIGVDGILTDAPALRRRLVRTYGLER